MVFQDQQGIADSALIFFFLDRTHSRVPNIVSNQWSSKGSSVDLSFKVFHNGSSQFSISSLSNADIESVKGLLIEVWKILRAMVNENVP